MSNEYLFVYGTLRRGHASPMRSLLETHAEYVSDAYFQGRMYRIDYYPGVVASCRQNDRVRGELLRLRQSKWLLERLDEYEACSPGYPYPTEFVRSRELFRLVSGQRLQAWIYLYNRPVDPRRLIESGDFLSP